MKKGIVSDGAGGFSDNWVNIAVDLPAGLFPEGEQENIHGGQLETPTRLRVVIRYRDDIRPRMRLREETKEQLFNIQSIIDVEYRKRWMTLSCEEGVAQ